MTAPACVFAGLFAVFCALGTTATAATVCRFESLPNMAGKTFTTGTVTRTNTAAIIEYDGGNTSALVCKPSPSQCDVEDDFSRTVVDFSYTGFMIVASHYPNLEMDAIGLATLVCQN